MNRLKLSPIQWSLNGERVCGAQLSRGRPLSGAPPSLTPRLRSALRERREKRSHSHYSTPRVAAFETTVQSRQSLVSRRAQRTSVTSPRVIYQPCGEVKLSNVIHFRIPVLFGSSGLLYFYYNLTCACLCYQSGATILENWIIRTYNGLSQVSYFGCWSQRGTSLFYHVHRRTFRRLGRYMI